LENVDVEKVNHVVQELRERIGTEEEGCKEAGKVLEVEDADAVGLTNGELGGRRIERFTDALLALKLAQTDLAKSKLRLSGTRVDTTESLDQGLRKG
jgi:hypothetical protein